MRGEVNPLSDTSRLSLSKRGMQLAERAPPKAVEKSLAVLPDRYDREKNPDGYISLLVAENTISADRVLKQFQRERSDVLPSKLSLLYDQPQGERRLRQAIARLFQRHVFAASGGGPRGAANPDNYACASGAGAILDMVFLTLCDDGDGVIIPAPYYPGFDMDLTCRANCVPVPAPLPPSENYRLTEEVLNAAEADCRDRGIRLRALLLSHPGNPLGQLLSRDELQLAVRWARQRSLHLICDEAYALSVFPRHRHAFVSMGDVLADTGFGTDVHLVWTFSKDFCMSGMRCGVLFTENPALIQALRWQCYFSSPSRDTQGALTRLLTDEAWLSSFLHDNALALQGAFGAAERAIRDAFGEHRVRWFASQAGFFIWIGLQAFMGRGNEPGQPTWEEEQELFDLFLERARVIVYPGSICHASEPGWYRCCFTAVPDEDTLRTAFQRIAAVLKETGRMS